MDAKELGSLFGRPGTGRRLSSRTGVRSEFFGHNGLTTSLYEVTSKGTKNQNHLIQVRLVEHTMPDSFEEFLRVASSRGYVRDALLSLHKETCDLGVLCGLLWNYSKMRSGRPLENVERALLQRRKKLRRLAAVLKKAFEAYNACPYGTKEIAEKLMLIWLGVDAQVGFLDLMVGHKGALKKEAWVAAAVEYTRETLGQPNFQKLADILQTMGEVAGDPRVPTAEDIRKRSSKYLHKSIETAYAAKEIMEGLKENEGLVKRDQILSVIMKSK